MTERIIVATFDSTNVAYDAASAINDLKKRGIADFKLKAGIMVGKDDRGNVSVLESKDRNLLGTAVGTVSGALIGLIGGAPGSALGAALGATAGLGGDAVMASLDEDFVEQVTRDMRPGKTAIIVEADEGSTRPVDDIVAAGGGHRISTSRITQRAPPSDRKPVVLELFPLRPKTAPFRSLPYRYSRTGDCRPTMEPSMKPIRILILASIAFIAPTISDAQVAGSTTVGVSVAESRDVALGWSAKRTILGHDVYNEQNERVGSIDDIIVSPDKAVSYAIVNAGGFLGLTKHDVAVPVSKFKLVDNKLILAGATKDALKDTPPFEYAR